MDKKKPLTPKIMLPNRNPKKAAARTPMPKKVTSGTQKPTVKPKPSGPIKKTLTPMPKAKITKKPTPVPTIKNKKVPAPMPTTKSGDINPFKMTPQQKSDYLRNPGRYSRG